MGNKQPSIKQAVIYIRTVTGPEGSETLQEFDACWSGQRTACMRMAHSLGATVIETFSDMGRSGTTMERPGLQSLLRRIESGNIKYVLAADTDRLTLSRRQDIQLMEMFREAKVEMVSPDQERAA